jgi:hypothetical protein
LSFDSVEALVDASVHASEEPPAWSFINDYATRACANPPSSRRFAPVAAHAPTTTEPRLQLPSDQKASRVRERARQTLLFRRDHGIHSITDSCKHSTQHHQTH